MGKRMEKKTLKDWAWQDVAETIVRRSEAALWSPAGRRGLGWLRSQGLDDHTIGRHRVGLSTAWWLSGPLEALDNGHGPVPITVPPGIVFPYPTSAYNWRGGDRHGRWAGINVRRVPESDGSAHWIEGSDRGSAFPYADVAIGQAGPSALIVEHEIQALLATQEASDIASTVAVGGLSQEPDPSALALLALCPWLLIATDHDSPGIQAAGRWIARFPHKARRVLLPHGKNVVEFHQAGGDVRAWLVGELARLAPQRN